MSQALYSGCEINFFSNSHLAPKFFKVVANSKKVGHHFKDIHCCQLSR